MYLGFQTGNILEKFTAGDNLNIVYYPQRNLFDQCLFAIQKHRYYIWQNNNSNFYVENAIDLPSAYISLYNYNIVITNDVLGYCANNIKQIGLNTIISTHSHRPSKIKKEDSVLMNSRLKNEDKIFFTQKAWESWRFTNNTHIIKYGIPDAFQYTRPYEERTKDILIMNLENTGIYHSILEAAKQYNLSCDIMSSINMSLNNLSQTMNNYKICIDLVDHNIINLLCSIACGCNAISMLTISSNDYGSTPGLHLISNINDLFGSIKTIIENTKNELSEQNSSQVKSLFNFEEFSTSMNNIFIKNNREIFVL